MKTVTAELVETRDKQDTRGRKITDEARRAEVLAGYPASGLTQQAYARREGINYHTFVAWRGKQRLAGASAPSPATPVRFAEVQLTAGAGRGRLEATLPDGVVVRGDEAVAVANLIRALRA